MISTYPACDPSLQVIDRLDKNTFFKGLASPATGSDLLGISLWIALVKIGSLIELGKTGLINNQKHILWKKLLILFSITLVGNMYHF